MVRLSIATVAVGTLWNEPSKPLRIFSESVHITYGYMVLPYSAHINVYFWARNDGSVPSDVKNGASTINTSNWVSPFFDSTSCHLERPSFSGYARGQLPGQQLRYKFCLRAKQYCHQSDFL